MRAPPHLHPTLRPYGTEVPVGDHTEVRDTIPLEQFRFHPLHPIDIGDVTDHTALAIDRILVIPIRISDADIRDHITILQEQFPMGGIVLVVQSFLVVP